MIRRILLIGLVVALVGGLAAIPAQATHHEPNPAVKAAIDKGIVWLAAQQHEDGYWPGWYDKCGTTALAVKKLMHHAVDPKWGWGLETPFDPDYDYKGNIEGGLDYLFRHCVGTMAIEEQLAGDPDSDGDGFGVYFGLDPWSRTYTSGIALMTICEAVELDRVVDVEGSPVHDWTYEDVAEDLMDYLAFGQTDGGSGQGGWGYQENADWSDNSNTGYVTLGLGFAEADNPAGCGFDVPQFVKAELNIWVDYIQNDVGVPDPLWCDQAATGDCDGGSGYQGPDSWVNILKTGNLLQQMAFLGDTVTTPRVVDALDYMERHWDDPNTDPGWRGDRGVDDDGDGSVDEDPWNGLDDDGDGLIDEDRGIPSNYQATFTSMKGLASLGLYDDFGDRPIYWQDDFEAVLPPQQIPVAVPPKHPEQGYWSNCNWGGPILCTTWALLTLQKVAPDLTPPEVECLETVNPHGDNVPPAGKTTPPGPKGGQNEDGFYQLTALDEVDPDPQIFVEDTGSGTVFGPFASGTKIKYTEAKGAPPSQKKIGSGKGQAGAVDWHITGNGDAAVYAVDASGNEASPVSCLVPPPPK